MSSFRGDDHNIRLAILAIAITRAALVVAASALSGGCGSSGPDYSELTAFCQALAQADCSQAVVTGCYGSSTASLPDDTQTCVTARATPERCNPLGLAYHAQYAQACIDAHAAAYMSGQLDAGTFATLQQQCLPALNQGGEVGASCSDDTDCDVGSGDFCVVHQGGSGTCQVPQPVMPGGDCSDPAAECSAGYFCESGGYCVIDPGQAGKACGPGVSCNTGLGCSTTTMTCAAQLPDSAACTVDSDCSGGLCISVSDGAECAATYTFAVGSATCADFVPN
jgi:hypothetical protein